METNLLKSESLPAYLPSLGRLLNFAAGATNRLCQTLLADHDLLLAQWVILSALWRQDGLLISDLARYAGSNPPAACRIVDRMVKNGIVRRRSDQGDARAVRVYLTKKGLGLNTLQDFYLSVNEHLLKGFSKTEKHALFSMLERIIENANEVSGQIEESREMFSET